MTYEGMWEDNKMHGKGVINWTGGKKYEGDFVKNLREGTGKFYWPDGR